MTKVMKVSEVINHARKEICNDCENKCELCKHGVCQDVVIEIGCYILQMAQKKQEKQ